MVSSQSPWRLPAAGLLIIAGVFALGLAGGQFIRGSSPLLEPDQPEGLPPEAPVRITIAALDLAAPVYPVGLDDRGAVAAPPLERAHETGWYRGGPAPGEDGVAVIVGHVDDRDGPAVFHRLPDLAPGSQVEVTRQDGRRVVFEVTGVQTYPKEHLPPEEVYGAGATPELRLITCGGRWVGGDLGYTDNVVVFATMVEADVLDSG